MRRLTPIALLVTVVAAFIVAKGCLPKRDLGMKSSSGIGPGLPAGTSEPAAEPEGAGGLATLADVEARHIGRVLSHTNGQIGAAAEILGIHRNTLARKIKEYGL